MTFACKHCALNLGFTSTSVHRSGAAGFTIIELMIVLTIMGILLGLAAPSLQSTIERNRREAVVTDFATAIQTARSNAVRSNKNAVVCASKSGTSCDSANWADGWMLFTEDKLTGDRQYQSADGEILLKHGALDTGYTLTSTVGEYAIVLSPTGEPKTNSGRYVICSPDKLAEHSKSLQLTAVGQLRADVQQSGDTCL